MEKTTKNIEVYNFGKPDSQNK